MPTGDLSERRLAAAEGAIAELVHRESWSARELATRALAAADTALATATSEETIDAAIPLLFRGLKYRVSRGETWDQGALAERRKAVRAAAAVLLAPAMQQVERLAHENGMLDEQLATIREENERQKDLFRLQWRATQAEQELVTTLRQRAEAAEQRVTAAERLRRALAMGNWCDSTEVREGLAWHVTREEHAEFERADMELAVALAALTRPASSSPAPEGV